MIPELNKIYILSAPLAAEGITNGADEYIDFTTADMTFVRINKVENAAAAKVSVKSLAKVFTIKNTGYQAVIFYTDLPDKVAKQRITETIERHQKNAKEQK